LSLPSTFWEGPDLIKGLGRDPRTYINSGVTRSFRLSYPENL